jgi:hydroxymethylglutaryl-CoA reductase (NADPH)
MSTDLRHISSYVKRLLGSATQCELQQQLMPKFGNPAPGMPRSFRHSAGVVDRRWRLLGIRLESRETLADPQTLTQVERYNKNIENLIGTVKVPVGLASPLRVNGLFAQGDYFIPLATTEAALVASYDRGSRLITEAGGCTAMILNEGISRSPCFAFKDLRESGQFVVWAVSQVEEFRRRAESTTRHGKLLDMSVTVAGNLVYLNFEFQTGDASGQNMVTFATVANCDYIGTHSPTPPRDCFLEGNLSGDKKASTQSFHSVRGKKVSAEVLLPPDLVRRHLHTTPDRMVSFWRVSALGGVLSGTMGVQGQYANGLAALYIACGQDAACVGESSVGVT